jgi:molybdopterin-containing oxidoreductase family iron-sulfur binding subunit
VAALAKDLLANKGRSVVIAGRRQPAAVHALVDAINVGLGNVGTTVAFWAARSPDPVAGAERCASWWRTSPPARSNTLVITAENPVYGAPVDFKLDQLLERVPTSSTLAPRGRDRGSGRDLHPKAHVSSPGATRRRSTARSRWSSR